jgi:hypothetical protein
MGASSKHDQAHGAFADREALLLPHRRGGKEEHGEQGQRRD